MLRYIILTLSLMLAAVTAYAGSDSLEDRTKIVVFSCPTEPDPDYVSDMAKDGTTVITDVIHEFMKWKFRNSTLTCKRVEVTLDDAALYGQPPNMDTVSPKHPGGDGGSVFRQEGGLSGAEGQVSMLNANLADKGQCVHAAAFYAPQWAKEHPGYWPFAVGCPSPIVNEWVDGHGVKHQDLIGYKLPDCPSEAIGGIKIICETDTAI